MSHGSFPPERHAFVVLGRHHVDRDDGRAAQRRAVLRSEARSPAPHPLRIRNGPSSLGYTTTRPAWDPIRHTAWNPIPGVGSIIGAVIGGMLVGIVPGNYLKIGLGIILNWSG